MSIPINKFIKNLEILNKTPIKILMQEITEMIFLILHQMAEYTITDTAQARSLLIKKFAEKYGLNADDLKEQHFFWQTSYDIAQGEDRDWGKGNSTLNEKISNKKFDININIIDEALHLQEIGRLKPSEYHSQKTLRDNSKFIQRQLTFVSTKVNKGAWNEVDGLEKNIENIIKKIENFIIK